MPLAEAVQQTTRERAEGLYARLRPQIETPENIGWLVVFDVDSGDYELDNLGIEAAARLRERNPGATLYALRVGYKTVVSFAGDMERTAS